MDGINGINGAAGVQPPMQQPPNNQPPPNNQGEVGSPPPFVTELSPLGQLFKTVESSNESAKSDLKQFHEDLFSALKDGNFDAQTLAENAPESVQEAAEAAGIDLTAALQDLEENLPPKPPHQGPPPPPPPESLGLSDEDPASSTIGF